MPTQYQSTIYFADEQWGEVEISTRENAAANKLSNATAKQEKFILIHYYAMATWPWHNGESKWHNGESK